ncbi:helix-turn-helix domain-containing protein [Gordonia amicalis]|uniref:helix-turn-helix domain-containing protein n=1 Tax=Gordonia amicalis TaxID=89053 RepID=UPI003A8064DE
MFDELIGVNEAAALVGYHPVTLRNKIRAGVLPAVRRGRRIFVNRNDLIALFEVIE